MKANNDCEFLTFLKRVMKGGLWHPDSKGHLKSYSVRISELTTEKGCVLWGRRMIKSASLRERVLK